MPTNEQLLNELVRLLGAIPAKATFRHDLPQNRQWLGSVLFVLNHSDNIDLARRAESIADQLHKTPITFQKPLESLALLLEQMKREIEFDVGYAIPRNYLSLDEDDKHQVLQLTDDLKIAVQQDNKIVPEDREIILSEIAVFEASLGVARLSADLISRFVNGVLRQAAIVTASAAIQEIASSLMRKLFEILEWPLSG
ncbi:MAG: hypothetical protein AAFQ21_13745 [Pseudomonadota bacterium]